MIGKSSRKLQLFESKYQEMSERVRESEKREAEALKKVHKLESELSEKNSETAELKENIQSAETAEMKENIQSAETAEDSVSNDFEELFNRQKDINTETSNKLISAEEKISQLSKQLQESQDSLNDYRTREQELMLEVYDIRKKLRMYENDPQGILIHKQ